MDYRTVFTRTFVLLLLFLLCVFIPALDGGMVGQCVCMSVPGHLQVED